MKLQDIYKLAEQWWNNDNARYSIEFYNEVIIDLIDRKQYARNRYPYKASYTDGLINWLNARYPHVIVTKFVYDLVENLK